MKKFKITPPTVLLIILILVFLSISIYIYIESKNPMFPIAKNDFITKMNIR